MNGLPLFRVNERNPLSACFYSQAQFLVPSWKTDVQDLPKATQYFSCKSQHNCLSYIRGVQLIEIQYQNRLVLQDTKSLSGGACNDASITNIHFCLCLTSAYAMNPLIMLKQEALFS